MERELNRTTPSDAWEAELKGADGDYTHALGFATNILIMGLMKKEEGYHLMQDLSDLVNQYNERFLSPLHEIGGEIYASYVYASRIAALLKAGEMKLELAEYMPASVYSPDNVWPYLLACMDGDDKRALAFAACIVQAGAEDYAMHRQNTRFDDTDEEGTRRLLASFAMGAQMFADKNGISEEPEYRQIVLCMSGLITENIAAMKAAGEPGF